MSKTEDLERHLSFHGVRPEKKIDYEGMEIYLADSGPHYDIKDKGFTAAERDKFSLGYYLTVWGIGVGGKPYGYLPMFFEALHDINISDKKNARLKTAEKEAKSFITEGLKRDLFHAQA